MSLLHLRAGRSNPGRELGKATPGREGCTKSPCHREFGWGAAGSSSGQRIAWKTWEWDTEWGAVSLKVVWGLEVGGPVTGELLTSSLGSGWRCQHGHVHFSGDNSYGRKRAWAWKSSQAYPQIPVPPLSGWSCNWFSCLLWPSLFHIINEREQARQPVKASTISRILWWC